MKAEFVVAGHLLAMRLAVRVACTTLGKDFDINDARNGMLWCSAIEYAYVAHAICFSYVGEPYLFKLHVLDANYINRNLADVGHHK